MHLKPVIFLATAAIGIVFFTSAAHSQGLTQRELRALIQQIVAENEPFYGSFDRDAGKVPPTLLGYGPPNLSFDFQKEALWYSFGWANLDGEDYDFGTPGGPPPRDSPLPDDPQGGRDGVRGQVAAPAPLPPAADEHGLPRQNPNNEAPPSSDWPEEVQPSTYYFPTKAQLLVELLRKHRAEGRNAWEPVLQEIELVIAKELKAINKLSSSSSRQEFDAEEKTDQFLNDCDEYVWRLAVGHLDKVAKERRLMVQRDRSNSRPSFEGYDVKVLTEPPAKEIYVVSDFKFKCLQRKGNERDYTLWERVHDGTANIAGNWHIAAVWNNGDRKLMSDPSRVMRFTKETQVVLTPERGVPAGLAPR